MKKVLSLILSAVMLLSLVPLTVFSVSAVTDSQGVKYTLSDDGTYYIVSSFDETTNEVVIPAEFNGLPIKEIGSYAFEDCDSLTSIVIPDSVTSIGEGAFEYCDRLTDIYCEAESQPDGWSDYWNYNCDATVHWGCEMTNTSLELGNIDGDEDVDASDYILIKRAVLNTFNMTEEQQKLADIDKDGDVVATDYVLVKRIVLGTYKIN